MNGLYFVNWHSVGPTTKHAWGIILKNKVTPNLKLAKDVINTSYSFT